MTMTRETLEARTTKVTTNELDLGDMELAFVLLGELEPSTEFLASLVVQMQDTQFSLSETQCVGVLNSWRFQAHAPIRAALEAQTGIPNGTYEIHDTTIRVTEHWEAGRTEQVLQKIITLPNGMTTGVSFGFLVGRRVALFRRFQNDESLQELAYLIPAL